MATPPYVSVDAADLAREARRLARITTDATPIAVVVSGHGVRLETTGTRLDPSVRVVVDLPRTPAHHSAARPGTAYVTARDLARATAPPTGTRRRAGSTIDVLVPAAVPDGAATTVTRRGKTSVRTDGPPIPPLVVRDAAGHGRTVARCTLAETPGLPDRPGDPETVTLDDDIADAVRRSLPLASPDHLRPVLAGVWFDTTLGYGTNARPRGRYPDADRTGRDADCYVAATDSYRLILTPAHGLYGLPPFFVPAALAAWWPADGPVDVDVYPNGGVRWTDGAAIVDVYGTPPDPPMYQNILAMVRDAAAVVSVDRDALVRAARTAFAPYRTAPVSVSGRTGISVGPDGIAVVTVDDVGAVHTVSVDGARHVDGLGVAVPFVPDFLPSTIAALPPGRVVLSVADDTSPLRAAADDGTVVLLMPVRAGTHWKSVTP